MRAVGPRRGRVWVGVAAVAVLWVFSAVLPIVMFLEARTVPSGTSTQQATVVGYDRGVRRTPSNNGLDGKIARVELPDGSSETVYLDYRWFYPDTGDTLTVYTEDGDLRATQQGSVLELVAGSVLLVVWPAITVGYLRARRRSRPTG